MAKLSDETLTVIFNLLRQLAEAIEDASATEWLLFERYGETERTLLELEELQNVRERLNNFYSRLNTALLGVLEAQPSAPSAMLDLLVRTIDQGQANFAAAAASVQEVKKTLEFAMNSSYPYPDEESRKKCLERLRETNRQLDLYNLQLEDLIAMIEAEARQQKRERLLKKRPTTP